MRGHQQLGRELAARLEWDRARWHFERSLEIQPSVQAWYTLAKLHGDTDEPEAARQALHAALLLQPDHLQSLRLLARVSSDLGDPTRAREVLERAATLVPGDHSIRSALVRARFEESQQRGPE